MRTLAITLICCAAAQAGLKRFEPRPVLIYGRHPDLPVSTFAAGSLGLPSPAWARIYLYAVYRNLEGRPLSGVEQRAFEDAWNWRRGYPPKPSQGLEAWLRIQGGDTAKRLRSQYRSADWVTFQPCSDDAFAMAARTYAERVRSFGASSAAVRMWMAGQEAVFGFCFLDEARGAIPEPVPAEAPPLIRADREYQIAAALFYAQRYDEAIARFEKIAADRTSPWRVWAPYLVGRSLIWKSRSTGTPGEYEPLVRQAQAKFEAVLADPALRESHSGADLLLTRCLMVTDLRRAIHRLSTRLAVREDDLHGRNLYHYLTALDMVFGTYRPENPPWWKQPSDTMSQWMAQFQSDQRWTYTSALGQWRKSGSRAWLYSALTKARASDGEGPELIRAALAADIAGPVGPMLHFAAADLLARRGDPRAAREILDHVLPRLAHLPSARNRALVARAPLASNFGEFLRLAPLRAVIETDEHDQSEFEEQGRSPAASMARLEPETAAVMNGWLPLRSLRDACLRPELPSHLRREACVVTFVRAALLDRVEEGRAAASELAGAYPRIAGGPRSWSAAPDSRARALAAAILLVEMPGASALMTSGYGRISGPFDHDEWGRNWWHEFPAEAPPFPLPFLSAEERAEAQRELAALREHRDGLGWITSRILEHVKARPDDPRAAELLGRCVSGTFLGMWAYDAPPQTPRARDAWRLLAARYRGSRWYRQNCWMESSAVCPER